MCNLHHYHLEALQIELSLDIHVRHKLLFIIKDYHSTRFYFTCWKFFLNIYHFTYKQHYLYTLESISVMSSLSKLFPRTITHASFYQLHQQRPDPFYFGAIYRVETWLGRCFILEPKTMYEKNFFEQKINFHQVWLYPNISTTPLRQWGFWQCLLFSWTTLRGKHCRHPIAVIQFLAE